MSQMELFPESDYEPTKRATPILKWAGGKRGLLRQFKQFFPKAESYKRYFEPFLGGGAVFFYLQPRCSYLYDINADLIEVYRIVQNSPEELIAALKPHHNDKDYYYQIRAQEPSELSPVERVARFIFLNRTCYNGLYRVNKDGKFNVPFGRYDNPLICDVSGLYAASKALQNAYLEVADFEIILQHAQEGDLIYFDPPYEPLSPTSNFTSYTSGGFTADDQRRLGDIYRELDRRGCFVMLSNSAAPLIYEIFEGYYLHEINVRRAINSNPEGRGIITELLVTNFQQSM